MSYHTFVDTTLNCGHLCHFMDEILINESKTMASIITRCHSDFFMRIIFNTARVVLFMNKVYCLSHSEATLSRCAKCACVNTDEPNGLCV